VAFVRWVFWSIVGFLVLCVLHYTLPQRDIVIVTGTEIIRQDVGGLNAWFYAGADSGNAVSVNRDLRLINTIDRNGTTRVYRNEDTGIGWPPYFKFDSADLQADAQAAISTTANPQWVAVRHYGWRSTLISIYPNATSLRPVSGPDQTLIPWFNIIFLTVFFAFVWGISVRVIRWRRRLRDGVDDAFDDARGWWGRTFGR
jgi:hypothetical protein